LPLPPRLSPLRSPKSALNPRKSFFPGGGTGAASGGANLPDLDDAFEQGLAFLLAGIAPDSTA
jgi:hypothetical protein